MSKVCQVWQSRTIRFPVAPTPKHGRTAPARKQGVTEANPYLCMNNRWRWVVIILRPNSGTHWTKPLLILLWNDKACNIMNIIFFWDAKSCSLLHRYPRFGGIFFWRWRYYIPPKDWYLTARLHRAALQKIVILTVISFEILKFHDAQKFFLERQVDTERNK